MRRKIAEHSVRQTLGKLIQKAGAIALILLCLFCATIPVRAAEISLEKVLPPSSCALGWVMDDKVILYNKDTLFDRINGEAELYFPYGFDLLASARYANQQDQKIAVDADVYKMGSLLDAFGMFANYRRKNDAVISIGAEGTISASQLFFYQDRYLVRLQVTGASSVSQDVLLACGRAVSQNLPLNTNKPKELELFMVPGVVQKSERYIAQSLLGYDFFHRGLMAEALVQNEKMQVFIILEGTSDAAQKVFDQYRAYLKPTDKKLQVTGAQGRRFLSGRDPLYGAVLVEQNGRFLIGVIRFKNTAPAKQLVEQIRQMVGE